MTTKRGSTFEPLIVAPHTRAVNVADGIEIAITNSNHYPVYMKFVAKINSIEVKVSRLKFRKTK